MDALDFRAKQERSSEEGRKKWYECYQLRIAKVERAYGFEAPKP